MRREVHPVVTLWRDVHAAVDRALTPRSARGGAAQPRAAATWPVGTGPRALRRGQVWLAESSQSGRLRPVLLLQRDGADDDSDVVIAAPLVRSARRPGRVSLTHADGLPERCAADVARLGPVGVADLVRCVASLSQARMDEVDAVLRDLLGLRAGVAATAPAPVRPAPPDEHASGVEAVPLDAGGFTNGQSSARLEDHPMAQLFGQTQPRSSGVSAAAGGSTGPEHTPIAAMLPDLRALVRARLHRAAPRLETVLEEGAASGRSVAWAAAVVRTMPIRGIVQPSLDELAATMLALARDRMPAG